MPIPISITNVSKTFPPTGGGARGRGGRGQPPHRALRGVSLEIPPGALYFLLGPSGCGKTTLLRILAGFTEPDAGSGSGGAPGNGAASGRRSSGGSSGGAIRFGERDVTRVPPEKRSIGMVFQSYALWPHMTVYENVEFGLRSRKTPREERKRRAAEALDLVQMGSLAQRKPAALSGGQQQRVALARALVVRPDVLLLDEPLSNLDARLRREMRHEISRVVRGAGLTAVYVTHDQEEALSMADGVAVMREGEILQVGPPREVYERPNSADVADILGPTNYLTKQSGPSGGVSMLRPEWMTVCAPGASDAPDAGVVRGTVEQSEYLGGRTELLIRAESGEHVRALADPRNAARVGDVVGLRLDRDRAVRYASRDGR